MCPGARHTGKVTGGLGKLCGVCRVCGEVSA